MITIRLNNKVLQLAEAFSLDKLMQQQGYEKSYVAVALNRHFVSRTNYSTTFLKEGDEIEIVAPMQGG